MTRSAPRFARRAFTLMEVLVVLAILAALAAMVLPRILGAQKKADLDNAKIQIHNFRAALDRYALSCKTYPTAEQGMAALLTRPEGLDESAQWDGPYLDAEELPKDPWGHDFNYAYPPTHGTIDRPDIWSNGPDGESDTEDDIVSWSKTASGEGGTSTK
jgi:general secretion pathway protein G